MLAPETIADDASGNRSEGNGAEEYEKKQLRCLHRDVELLDQIERVIAGHACDIEKLRQDQYDQHQQGQADFTLRNGAQGRVTAALMLHARGTMLLVPITDTHEQQHCEQGRNGEPGDAALPVSDDDERGEQRAHCGTDIAAHLKQCLRKPRPVPGREPRNTRRFGVQNGGADPNQARRKKQYRVSAGA